MRSERPIGYKDAGVHIDEADRAVTHIRKHARHVHTGCYTPRILRKGLAARVYRRTFNLGIGMSRVVASRWVPTAQAILGGLGESFFEIGAVVKSRGPRVEYVGGAA